jgi:hypothetical protein
VFLLAALLVVYCFFIWITLRFSGRARPYIASGLAMLWAVLFLNLAFYPALLKYQSGNQLAFYVNKYYPSASIGRFGFYMPSGEFYLQKHMIKTDTADIQSGTRAPDLLFLSEDELSSLRSAQIRHEVIKVFEEFHVTMLTLKFLDPARRNDQLKPLYLVRLLR